MSSNWRQSSNSGRSNWQWKNQNQKKRKHNYNLEPGLSGFLCTCNGKFREKECVRDSYNLLNEFADKIFGPEEWGERTEEAENGSGDVDASLEEEISALKEKNNAPSSQRRFQVIESGVNGIVFIKTTVPDPAKLAHNIVSTIAGTKVQKSKFLLRLVPVEVTCKANLEEILKAAEGLFAKHFKDGNKTFAIVFCHKNNESLKRDPVTEALAAQIIALNSTNKVDLKTPKLAVLVEIIRSVCCLAVMPDYYALKKYNILELCVSQDQKQPGGVDEAIGRPGEKNAADQSMVEDESAARPSEEALKLAEVAVEENKTGRP